MSLDDSSMSLDDSSMSLDDSSMSLDDSEIAAQEYRNARAAWYMLCAFSDDELRDMGNDPKELRRMAEKLDPDDLRRMAEKLGPDELDELRRVAEERTQDQ